MSTSPNGNTVDVEMAVTLIYLSNLYRDLEMTLINYDINHLLTWSENCVISFTSESTTFSITDTKYHIPIATLSIQGIQGNTELLEQ